MRPGLAIDASPRRSALVRDIVVLVTIKLIALAVIYALFFAPAARAPVDPAARLLGPASPTSSPR
ncbi:MAG: hypothetical protein JSR45_12365 [Proteobacteria bacterium]|nr:hypothetical protein [Pseudomonadota bacterium]